MLETWVRSLGWEDPLEEGRQPSPVFLPGESPWTEEPGGLQSMGGFKESDTTEQLNTARSMALKVSFWCILDSFMALVILYFRYINSEEKVSEAINSSPKKYAKCF